MWIRERPLVSHGQIGESRYLKILGTRDWGMGGNKERAREPSVSAGLEEKMQM